MVKTCSVADNDACGACSTNILSSVLLMLATCASFLVPDQMSSRSWFFSRLAFFRNMFLSSNLKSALNSYTFASSFPKRFLAFSQRQELFGEICSANWTDQNLFHVGSESDFAQFNPSWSWSIDREFIILLFNSFFVSSLLRIIVL